VLGLPRLGLDLPRVALDPCGGDGALRRCLAPFGVDVRLSDLYPEMYPIVDGCVTRKPLDASDPEHLRNAFDLAAVSTAIITNAPHNTKEGMFAVLSMFSSDQPSHFWTYARRDKGALPHGIARPMRTPRLQSCCLRRSRRVMLGSSYGRAGRSSSRCARLWTPPASLNGTSPSSGSSSRTIATADPRRPPGSPSRRLLSQTEQPKSSPFFQGTARAEPATARRAKLTPR
jgi:hypothetical protein